MHQMRRLVLAAASLSLLGGMAVNANSAGATEGEVFELTLLNQTAGVESCPTAVTGPAWHFVAPPKSKTDFVAITLLLKDANGVDQSVPIGSWQEIPLTGDAYVAVPAGYTITSLVNGTFMVAGDPVDQYVRLSHTCAGDPPDEEVTPPVITVSKDAAHTTSSDYDWTVVKTVKAYRLRNDGKVDVDYEIAVTKSELGNQTSTVTGTITVKNDGVTAVTLTSVTDDIDGTLDDSCVVNAFGAGQADLQPGDVEQFGYTCAVPYGSEGLDTNVAAAFFSWDAGNGVTRSSKAEGTYGFEYATPVPTDATITVTDDYGTPGNLLDDKSWEVSASATFTYTRPAVTAGGTACNPGFVNTASLTDQLDENGGNSSSATVQLCTNSNGFTIGFWGNKNGWNLLKSPSTIRSNVNTLYGNVAGYAGITTWTSTGGRTFFTNANCSGTCKSMFAAQFLATAFNVQRTPSLGTTMVVVPPSLSSLFDPQTCVSINTVLSVGNTYFTSIGADNLSTTTALKSLYDRINNNEALTCT